MKGMLKFFSVFSFFILFSACATTTQHGLPAKYDLGNELKQVDQINTFTLSSWEEVDNQSIILETSRHKYYLLILRDPIVGRLPSLTLGISTTISSITAGFDKSFSNETGVTQYYYIDKIYELKDREQAELIKKQLRKK